MVQTGQVDQFVIVNGPQDGTEFPITRTPFDVGQDRNCAVQISLDPTVRPLHARVTSVSEGYRIRNWGSKSVSVDAKRVRPFRSRIVRSRGLIRVGHTLLMVRCAPDGLAARSHGVIGQSDFIWLGQQALNDMFSASRIVLSWLCRIIGRVLTSWIGVCAVLALLYAFWPLFRGMVNNLVSSVYFKLLSGLATSTRS